MPHKRVAACASIGPNYLCHLLAVARFVFDSDYADQYAETVSPEDRSTLCRHGHLIAFGGENAGELIDIIVSLPMVAGLASAGAFEEYFRDVHGVAQSHDIYPFIKKYRFYPEYMHPFPGVGHAEMRLMVGYRDQIAELADVIVCNFPTYEKRVWPQELPALERVKADLANFFAERDVIGTWEKLTRLNYERPAFYPELCSAIKNGPNASAFAYDRVLFYHDTPQDKLIQLISHEIGTHLMYLGFQEVQSTCAAPYESIYHAMESLAMFYNSLVLETPNLAYNLDEWEGREYVDVYRELHALNPGLDARDMIRKALQFLGKT